MLGGLGSGLIITLHWRLILAPRKIQDYVVANELAHCRHDEHSDAFWNTVGTLVPDYRERREWLRVKGGTLTVEDADPCDNVQTDRLHSDQLVSLVYTVFP